MTVGDLDTLTPLRHDIDVLIPLDDITLEGLLSVPEQSEGIVLFAHGSGSTRHSPHNHRVAEYLYEHRLSILLVDLLTEEEQAREEKIHYLRPDIRMLADRLAAILAWMQRHEKIGTMPVGMLGTSTGAAAALVVAADNPSTIKAVVSRAGRPDLAGKYLSRVEAPVLLIVGGHDREMLKLNEAALTHLNDRSRLKIVGEASPAFSEPKALDKAAKWASEWFSHYLTPSGG